MGQMSSCRGRVQTIDIWIWARGKNLYISQGPIGARRLRLRTQLLLLREEKVSPLSFNINSTTLGAPLPYKGGEILYRAIKKLEKLEPSGIHKPQQIPARQKQKKGRERNKCRNAPNPRAHERTRQEEREGGRAISARLAGGVAALVDVTDGTLVELPVGPLDAVDQVFD